MTHSDLESFVENEGRELLRQLLQAHLDLRAGAKVAGPVVGADGVERTHHRASPQSSRSSRSVTHFSAFGEASALKT